jgi:hypothetical protein
MVSTGYLLFCIIQPGLRANFSRESLQPSHWEGAGWSSTHSSRCGTGFGGMQHSLKAGSHLGEGPRGQRVRWNVPTSIPGPSRRQWPRECPLRKFLKGEFATFPMGKALGGPAPTARAVDRARGDAALFESLFPPFVKGGLRGQGVRWSVPTSIPEPTLRRLPREGPLPTPPTLFPPLYDSHFPRRPISGQCGSPKSRPVTCFVASCQKPGDVSPQASSLSKSRCIQALQPLRLRG